MIRFDILQLKLSDDPKVREYLFSPAEFLVTTMKKDFPASMELYETVHSAEQEGLNPNEIFRIFNTAHPADYKGRSLSVSDIIRYHLPSGKLFHLYCDDFGFFAVDIGDEFKVATMPKYVCGAGRDHDTVIFEYQNGDFKRGITVDVPMLLVGEIVAHDENGQDASVTLAEIYNTVRLTILHQHHSELKEGYRDVKELSIYEIIQPFL